MSDECLILEVTIKKRFARQQGFEPEPQEQQLEAHTYRLPSPWEFNKTAIDGERKMDERIQEAFPGAERLRDPAAN